MRDGRQIWVEGIGEEVEWRETGREGKIVGRTDGKKRKEVEGKRKLAGEE